MPGLWGRNLPACGLIPLLYLLTITIHCDRAACQSQNPFSGVFTETGPLIALAVAVALLVGIAGPASAQFFNFGVGGHARSRAARRRLVRRRSVRAVPAAGAASAAPRIFPGAAAGEARHRAGAQRAGARRRHGGLARLRPRGRLCRAARHGRDPQAQDRLRPDQVSAQGRAGRLGRRRQGHPRHREARRHRRHARPQRPRRDPRAGGREIRQVSRQEGRQEGRPRQAGRCKAQADESPAELARPSGQARREQGRHRTVRRTMPPTTTRRRSSRRRRARARRTASTNSARSAGSNSTPRRSRR